MFKAILNLFRSDTNCAVIKLMGGLGNQMFQYAFGQSLAYKTGQKVVYDVSWFEESKKAIINEKNESKSGVVIRPYYLDIFNLDIEFVSKKDIKKYIKVKEKNEFIYNENLFIRRKNPFYVGYFQNGNYFKDIKEKIKKDFTFTSINANDEYNQNWLEKIRECENPVFIHLRRGDYVNLGWNLSTDYYKNAIKYISENVPNPTFFIFGQNCEEYIKNEFNIDIPFEIIGETNSQNKEDWKDIVLMEECRHAIIANSTFSWWAAWLGRANTDGIIVAPTPFINGQDEIICDNWVKIAR